MTDINSINATIQEQARIREGVAKLQSTKMGMSRVVILQEVLAVIRNSKTPEHGHNNNQSEEGRRTSRPMQTD
jgi:hypothetical protein